MTKISAALLASFAKLLEVNCSLYFANENDSAAPTMKRKNGKTRSVGVHPLHGACFKGGNIEPHDPGLLTRIIPATVMPRSTSSAAYLCVEIAIIVSFGLCTKLGFLLYLCNYDNIFHKPDC